jgi:hypothetical protein
VFPRREQGCVDPGTVALMPISPVQFLWSVAV